MFAVLKFTHKRVCCVEVSTQQALSIMSDRVEDRIICVPAPWCGVRLNGTLQNAALYMFLFCAIVNENLYLD